MHPFSKRNRCLFSNNRTIFSSFVCLNSVCRILYRTDILINRHYTKKVEEALSYKKSMRAKYISCTDIIFLQYLGKLKTEVFVESRKKRNIFIAFKMNARNRKPFSMPPSKPDRSGSNHVYRKLFQIINSLPPLSRLSKPVHGTGFAVWWTEFLPH